MYVSCTISSNCDGSGGSSSHNSGIGNGGSGTSSTLW